jgi:hypothetical protein
MKKRLILIVLTFTVMSCFNLYGQESKKFDYKIKGDKCEYNVKNSKINSSIDISNVNNTYGTDRNLIIQDYGKTYKIDEYVSIYKIIKSSIDPRVFSTLLNEEKIPYRNIDVNKYDKQTREKLKNANHFTVAIIFAPVTGKIFEVEFNINGDILKKLSPDCFCEIEKKIKESGITHKAIIEKSWQTYIIQHYEYYFFDLDSFVLKGEKAILSNIK